MTSHAHQVARSAVIHGLPAVDLHRHLVSGALDRLAPEYEAPVNDLVVHGGGGAPWWHAWLDLRAEPVVLRLPAAPEGPGIQVELIDLRGMSRARTLSPDDSGRPVLIQGPRWHGRPQGPAAPLECPTEVALLLIAGRSVVGRRGHPAPVLDTLSTVLGRPAPTPTLPPAVPDLAVIDVGASLDARFLHVLDVLLPLMPPRPGEELQRAELVSFGIGADVGVDLPSAAGPLAELEAGLGDGLAEVRSRSSMLTPGDGNPPSHRELHADYLSRAAAAHLGWYRPEQHIQVLAPVGS